MVSEDDLLDFSDEKRELIWFMQPLEARLFLVAAERLKNHPMPFKKTTLPFNVMTTPKWKPPWSNLKSCVLQ